MAARQERLIFVLVSIAALLTAPSPRAAWAHQAVESATAKPAPTMQDEKALKDFDAAVQAYGTVRASAQSEVPEFVVTRDVAQTIRTSDQLAIAIRRARPKAQQGDFFSAEVRRVIVERLTRTFAETDLEDLITPDPDERSQIDGLQVYARYPVNTPLMTMPPAVLKVLPTVPDTLEYRFVGRDLVLRDRDAKLILDYIKNVLPAK